jgi:hypothetical protein
MVHFDDAQKIVQIRMYWDQGALLKQIDVIGARARNWPIRDGKDQTRLISTSYATVAQSESASASRPSTGVRGQDEVSIAERPVSSSRRGTNNAMNDPHATLNLFQPRQVNLEESSHSRPIQPRMQSAKPPPRDMSELFVGEDAASPSPANASSPQKHGGNAKGGAGKSYKANRLFDETDEDNVAATPMSSVKTNAKKYSHFEFGDGEDETTPKQRETRPAKKTQHASQWDFDDFVTPEKTKAKVLPQQVRQWGNSDDEVRAISQMESLKAVICFSSNSSLIADVACNRTKPLLFAGQWSTRPGRPTRRISNSSTTAPPRVSARRNRPRAA